MKVVPGWLLFSYAHDDGSTNYLEQKSWFRVGTEFYRVVDVQEQRWLVITDLNCLNV